MMCDFLCHVATQMGTLYSRYLGAGLRTGQQCGCILRQKFIVNSLLVTFAVKIAEIVDGHLDFYVISYCN